MMEGPLSKLIVKASSNADAKSSKRALTKKQLKRAAQKTKNAKPSKTAAAQPSSSDSLDKSVAKALYDIQTTNTSLSADLRPLQFHSAREVELGSQRKAIVLSVPVPQLKAWRRVQLAIARELEKKFSDRTVVIVAQRRIIPKPKHGAANKQARPRSRTLTAVHDAWLEDMVYPTEIVGKRIRVKSDGKRLIKVFLDPKDQTALESKVDVFAAVYKKLTGKDVVFDFPLVNSK